MLERKKEENKKREQKEKPLEGREETGRWGCHVTYGRGDGHGEVLKGSVLANPDVVAVLQNHDLEVHLLLSGNE